MFQERKNSITILKTTVFIDADFLFTEISDHFSCWLYFWRKCWICHRISFTFKKAVSSFSLLRKYINIGNMWYFLMQLCQALVPKQCYRAFLDALWSESLSTHTGTSSYYHTYKVTNKVCSAISKCWLERNELWKKHISFSGCKVETQII